MNQVVITINNHSEVVTAEVAHEIEMLRRYLRRMRLVLDDWEIQYDFNRKHKPWLKGGAK